MFAAMFTQTLLKATFRFSSAASNGIYHHVSQQHLKRYLAEFDFRYNNRVALGVEDVERAAKIVRGASGKRLMYRRTNEASAA